LDDTILSTYRLDDQALFACLRLKSSSVATNTPGIRLRAYIRSVVSNASGLKQVVTRPDYSPTTAPAAPLDRSFNYAQDGP